MFGIIIESVLALLAKIAPDQLKNNFKSWKANLTEQNMAESLIRIGQWGHKTDVMLFKDFSSYVRGEMPSKGGIIRVTITRLSCILLAIRFGLPALVDSPLIKTILTDLCYSLGNYRLTCLITSCTVMNTFNVGAVIQYQEMTRKLKAYEFFDSIIGKKPRIKLSPSKQQSLTLGIYVMSEYLLRQYYLIGLILAHIVFYSVQINNYMDPNSGYSLFWMAMWVTPTYLFLKHGTGVLCVGTCYWIFCAFYLKYVFSDTKNKLEMCLKLRNPRLLKKAIVEHNSAVKLCEELNEFFKYMVFLLYYLMSPVYMLSLYYIISDNTDFLGVLVTTMLMSFTYFLVLLLNLQSSQISKHAQCPSKLLYSYASSRILPHKENIKIMTYIERLCGPDIGFYCLDWFPMNSYEFYQYCANCMTIFILCNGLFASF